MDVWSIFVGLRLATDSTALGNYDNIDVKVAEGFGSAISKSTFLEHNIISRRDYAIRDISARIR